MDVYPPHGIRYDALTAAVNLAREHGIELPSVLKFSRHKDLATLMVYLDLVQNRQGEIAALVASSLKAKKPKADEK